MKVKQLIAYLESAQKYCDDGHARLASGKIEEILRQVRMDGIEITMIDKGT
jgi:hypothetical protein